MFAVGSLRRLLPQASLSRFAAAASGLEAQQGKLKCLLAQPCTSSCPCPCTLCQAHGFCSKPPTMSGEEEGQKGKGGGKDDHKNTQVGQPVVGINYKKGGSDPLIKEDGEYPDWLWSMLDPKPTLSELDRKLKPILAKELNGIDDLRKLRDAHEQDIRRYAKLLGTARVKENNKSKEK